MLIYADSIFLTSQPGLKVKARNANILPAILHDVLSHLRVTSGSIRNTEKKLHFFSFPKPISNDQQIRSDIWIEFCKPKKPLFRQNAPVCIHYILVVLTNAAEMAEAKFSTKSSEQGDCATI